MAGAMTLDLDARHPRVGRSRTPTFARAVGNLARFAARRRACSTAPTSATAPLPVGLNRRELAALDGAGLSVRGARRLADRLPGRPTPASTAGVGHPGDAHRRSSRRMAGAATTVLASATMARPAGRPHDRSPAEPLDAADPLAAFAAPIRPSDEVVAVYLDGNSLGRPLAATARAARSASSRSDWGGRLIRGWDERWMDLPFAIGDPIGGARRSVRHPARRSSATRRPCCSTSSSRGVRSRPRPGRVEIVVDRDNFPTDRYVVEGIAAERGRTLRWIDVDPRPGVTAERSPRCVGDAHRGRRAEPRRVPVRAILADVPALTASPTTPVRSSSGTSATPPGRSRSSSTPGASTSPSAAPTSTSTAARARPRSRTSRATCRTQLAPADPGLDGRGRRVRDGPEYAPADGMRRFLSGTPPIVGMLAMQDTLEMIEDAGIDADPREVDRRSPSSRSSSPTSCLRRFGVASWRRATTRQRGGHVTLSHPSMREVTARLWAQERHPRLPRPRRPADRPVAADHELRRGRDRAPGREGRVANRISDHRHPPLAVTFPDSYVRSGHQNPPERAQSLRLNAAEKVRRG